MSNTQVEIDVQGELGLLAAIIENYGDAFDNDPRFKHEGSQFRAAAQHLKDYATLFDIADREGVLQLIARLNGKQESRQQFPSMITVATNPDGPEAARTIMRLLREHTTTA